MIWCDSTGRAFKRSNGYSRLFGIGAIGPHWIYLIRWHNVTYNESSYRDLMALAELAGSL